MKSGLITLEPQMVLYVKGGPVRVRGVYQGKWTVLTDTTATTYERHAWNDSLSSYYYGLDVPIDTIFNDIYIIDDLINVDSDEGDMSEMQPNENTCVGGSRNIMGLLSGGNIIIANTPENGAGNGCTASNGNCSQTISGIRINAGMMALNESFVVHYWQNSTNNQGGLATYASGYQPTGYWYDYDHPTNGWFEDESNDFFRRTDQPPWGDNRGEKKDPGASTGINDKRGKILMWGGVVQRYRGYVQ